MNCPRCGSALKSTPYDGVQIYVCKKCEGEWLPGDDLLKIVEHHEEVFTEAEIDKIDAVNKEIFTVESADHDELNCPQCTDVLMEHFNYGDTSGVILHKCNDCGGVWTDKGELLKVEALVDGWKQHLNDDSARYGSILEKIEVKEQEALDAAVSISRFGFVNAVLRTFCE